MTPNQRSPLREMAQNRPSEVQRREESAAGKLCRRTDRWLDEKSFSLG